jgi:3'(2'), 5'-bisphosphate nucleotidase
MPPNPPAQPAEHEGSTAHGLSKALLGEVVQIAQLAGDAIMAVYERGADAVDSNISTKDDNSPLTEADLAAHHVIVGALNALTPDIAVVSEEDASSLVHRTDKNTFWLIDPLDGTKEFIARNGEFTVNVALIIGGQPVWGVVHAPALNVTYWGGQSFGALKEERTPEHVSGDRSIGSLVDSPIDSRIDASMGSPANTSDSPAMRLNVADSLRNSLADCNAVEPLDDEHPGKQRLKASIRVVASKSHLNQETEDFIRRLGVVELVQAGSSLKLCKIAEGSADIYPRLAPTCEWDTAAAQAVVEGAGGYVFDTEGNRLRYGKTELLNPSFIVAAIDYDSLQSLLQTSD